jgi:oligopeptide/dipeptide ABC transporter ATP-binding protein
MTHHEPLLEAAGLTRNFLLRRDPLDLLLRRPAARVRAVDGVDLSLQPGEILGLVGESGSGKTTVGRLVTMLDTPSSGTLRLQGEDLSKLSSARRQRLRRVVQMVFQNPYESLDPRFTVGAWVGQAIRRVAGGSGPEVHVRVLDALRSVGLTPAESFVDRLPGALSGGQRQRVDIARAFAVDPQLIVADEPVSMLDVSVRSGILKLILSLREARGVGYLFITHDLAVARYVSDRIAVMYRGRIVESGATDVLIRAPAHPYTRLLVASVPEPDPSIRRDRPQVIEREEVGGASGGCRFRQRCAWASERCRHEEPLLSPLSGQHQAACFHAAEVSAGGPPPAGRDRS